MQNFGLQLSQRNRNNVPLGRTLTAILLVAFELHPTASQAISLLTSDDDLLILLLMWALAPMGSWIRLIVGL
jgi:hypothetical protein